MPSTPSARRRRLLAAAVAVTSAVAAAAPAQARAPIRLRYAIEGTATIRTLTRGVLHFTGTADGALQLADGTFTADLDFDEATGDFLALGFLPVRATVQIVPEGPATGTIDDTGVKADARLRIELPSVTLLGVRIGGGGGCATRAPAAVALRSAEPQSPLEPMTVASTFTIGAVSGCGPLTALVSPLAAGRGNALAMKLTPEFQEPRR